MSIFTGSGVAVVTPFDNKGAINYPVYERLIKFHINAGTNAIISCGTTGEATTLTKDEHVEVVRQAVAFTNKNIPVIAGIGGNDTAKCIDMAKAAVSVGADAVMCVTPYYNKTSQKGLVQHFSAVAAAVDVPIVAYNVPSRTALNIQPKTLVDISKIPNIVAIKEASSDISQIAEMIERTGDRLTFYSGNDDQIVPILSLGGKGVISTIANIIPSVVHSIVALYLEGNHKDSLKKQLGILPLIRQLFADINPMPVKAALNLMGYNVGQCRLPLTTIDDSLHESLKQEMIRFGIVGE